MTRESTEEGGDIRSAAYSGWLKTDKAAIVNEHGDEVQLTGISTHGIQWFGELYNAESIALLKKEFGINLFRIAMYTDPDAGGYIANKTLKDKVVELIDASIAEDLYVIVDWHILGDNNPRTYTAEALEFFDEISEKYADVPNVIYEICNEPNGETDWRSDIKPYAEEVIAKIRSNSPRSLVIVGTPDWSKDLGAVEREPLSYENVAYALHFYAGSHNKTLRNKIDDFRANGLAVFVSECGATTADGDGKIFDEAFMRWANYMHKHKISWTYWSFSNKAEGSAMVKPEFSASLIPKKADSDSTSGSSDDNSFSLDKYLTDSGRLAKKALLESLD